MKVSVADAGTGKQEHAMNRVLVRRMGFAALVLGLMTLAACNTVEGVGKDVKATGAAIERAADGD